MPLKSEPFHDKVLFPFFDGLIPEGWLLDITERRSDGFPSGLFKKDIRYNNFTSTTLY